MCARSLNPASMSHTFEEKEIYIRFEIFVRGKRSQSLASLYIISSNVVVWVSSERERDIRVVNRKASTQNSLTYR